MPKVIVVILLLVLVVPPLSILGQTPSTQQGEEKVVTGTTEVIFDAVVKDKKGRQVKDLQVEDKQGSSVVQWFSALLSPRRHGDH